MKSENCSVQCESRRFLKLWKNNALSKIQILHFVYQFLKWTSFRTIWWYLVFYGSITCMNTIAQLIITWVLHSLQFATNILQLTWNFSKKFSLLSVPLRMAERWPPRWFAGPCLRQTWSADLAMCLFNAQACPWECHSYGNPMGNVPWDQRRSQNEAEEAMPTPPNGRNSRSNVASFSLTDKDFTCLFAIGCETIRLKHATVLAKLPFNADNTSWGVAWMKCKRAAFLQRSTNSDETFLRGLFARSIAGPNRSTLG